LWSSLFYFLYLQTKPSNEDRDYAYEVKADGSDVVTLIKYPEHDMAFNQLESLKAKGAKQTCIMPLTVSTVYSIPDQD
jgi:hypothetical protein